MEGHSAGRLEVLRNFHDPQRILTDAKSVRCHSGTCHPADEIGKIGGPRSLNEWFNTAALAGPPFGFYGNAAPGIIQGPGVASFDMALYKDFRIKERHTVEFRAEFFNIFNHTNFNGVSTGFGSANFGQVVSALDPRIMEFALRYQF
jgi:hypothetical protein